MSDRRLVLEILNGPLDGHKVKLETETFWSKKGEGPLIFPWDTELGDPQARFFSEGDEWWVEGFKAQHGTCILNREKRVEGEGSIGGKGYAESQRELVAGAARLSNCELERGKI